MVLFFLQLITNLNIEESMKKDDFYLAALLHDIGKFIERAKTYDNKQVKEDYHQGRYAHANYSGFYLSTLQKASQQNPFLKELITNDVIEGAYFHHNPKNTFHKIIQLADWLSSSEREENKKDEEKEAEYQKYNAIALKSIFSQEQSHYSYDLNPLDVNYKVLFPNEKEGKVNASAYKTLLEKWNPDMGKVTSQSQIYALLQRYFWCIPSATVGHEPVISLFDHSKTTAAIALCLLDQFQEGFLNKEELKEILTSYLKIATAYNDKKNQTQDLTFLLQELTQNLTKNPHFLLIRGDLSGIQEFIFNVSSKQAAKSLKGRSAYLSLLSKMAAQFFIDQLDLKEANLLYTGGGNFNILAPYCKKEAFEKAKKDFLEKILNKHGGDLYFALGYTKLSCYDFIDFGLNWESLSHSVNSFKARKWSELDLKQNYHKIFKVSQAIEETKVCSLCKSHKQVESRKIKLSKNTQQDEETLSLCLPCHSYIELGEELRNASFMAIKKSQPNPQSLGWFEFLGYQMQFGNNKDLPHWGKQGYQLIKLNNTHIFDPSHEPCQSFYFFPVAMPYHKEKQRIKTFEELTQKSKGDQKLGILKIDIDNLGSLFASQTRSISRLTQLSKMISLFFEGYLSKLIQEFQDYEQALYVVFSGGDDAFILGAYDVLLTFADEIREDFEKYTAHNPAFSFSAGFTFSKAKERVSKFGYWAEEALEDAKTMLYPNQQEPTKDKISLLNEAFNWKELKYLRSMSSKIVDLIENQNEKKRESRALIYKLQKSCKGFESILAEKRKKRFKPMQLKIWRLGYYLRNMLPANAKEKEELIKLYEQIVFDKDPKVKNPMILPVAIRLAELQTKKK